MDSLSKASTCFDHLTHLDSTSVVGHYYAGIAAERAGDKAKALAHLKHALELDPASVRIKEAISELQ